MAIYDDLLDVVPGPDRPIEERVAYVERRTISELEAYADDVGFASVREMPQNTFTAALRHCCKMIFKPAIGAKSDYFKIDLADKTLIFALAQLFIDLCDRYNKICQIQALAAYLGISDEFLYRLSRYNQRRYNDHIDISNGTIYDNYMNDNNIYDCNNSIYDNGNNGYNGNCGSMPNPGSSADVIKAIKGAKERQLQGLLVDGKGQLVGVLAILNYEFGYSKQDAYSEPSINLTSTERQKALADKYRVSALPDKLSDN